MINIQGYIRIFIKCHLEQKKLDVMVASWACEVTEILKQRSSKEGSFL